MNSRVRVSVLGVGTILVFAVLGKGQKTTAQPIGADDSEARPPVTKTDLQIVLRARRVLDAASKWNRADNRICPAAATVFSLYCALERATADVTGSFEHRGAVMQEARFVIAEIAPKQNYEHRLMGYNNDPSTTFADIQKMFSLLEARIEKRLAEEPSNALARGNAGAPPDRPLATKTDLQIIRGARGLLNSNSKWNRADTQKCAPDAGTFSLYCALKTSAITVSGAFDDHGIFIREARSVISETAPNGEKYRARVTDYNNDPTTTFSDIQKLLQTVEDRIVKQLALSGPK